MKRGHPSPYALGLDFGPGSLRLVEVERLRKGIRLLQCRHAPYARNIRFRGSFDSSTKKAYLEALLSLLSVCQPKSRQAYVGLDSRSLLLRRIAVDAWLEGDELRNQVLWETQQVLTDPLEQYVVDFHIQRTDAAEREVLLVVARKKILEAYIDIVHQGGLEPACLDVDLIALGNAYEYIAEGWGQRPTCLVDVEESCLRCTVVHRNIFWFGRTVEVTSPPADLDNLLTIAAAKASPSHGSAPFSEIVMCGSQSAAEPLSVDLSRFAPSVRMVSPLGKMKLGASVSKEKIQTDIPRSMVGLGLALRGATEQ